MNILPFDFEGAAIRVTVGDDGALWFAAKDVAEALGYTWARSATIAHVPSKWKGSSSDLLPNNGQELLTISEQGLYFFIGRSDKPKALPFQEWIAGEVIPSIRKTGGYMAPAHNIPTNLRDALMLAADLEGERMRLAAVVETQAPKVEAHDRFLDTSQTFTLTHLAKSCGTTGVMMIRWLRSAGYIHRSHADNPPNAKAIDKGLMVVVNRGYKVVSEDDGSEDRTRPQTRVTALGMSVLSNEYANVQQQGTLRLVAGGGQ